MGDQRSPSFFCLKGSSRGRALSRPGRDRCRRIYVRTLTSLCFDGGKNLCTSGGGVSGDVGEEAGIVPGRGRDVTLVSFEGRGDDPFHTPGEGRRVESLKGFPSFHVRRGTSPSDPGARCPLGAGFRKDLAGSRPTRRPSHRLLGKRGLVPVGNLIGDATPSKRGLRGPVPTLTPEDQCPQSLPVIPCSTEDRPRGPGIRTSTR